MYIIGISAYYHDSSACLFKNGELLFACEEEKFTGIKHDSSFPHKTIDYIFKKYNLSKEDIDCVCYYEKPSMRLKRKKSFLNSLVNNIKVWYNLRKISRKVHYTPHHLSHMAYSYYSSNFTESVIVSIDGVGETSTVSFGKGVGG
jgi:carbamoyltransferase